MGLFDKKYCDICGTKIGLLGGKKLEDGLLCKDCANKLSPWFSDRRGSTVEEIRNQLAYREENLEAVKAFNTTRVIQTSPKILVDEDSGKFMITNATIPLHENPDVLDLSQISDTNLRIDESRDEIKYEDAEGKKVSYDPKAYHYSHSFYLDIYVNHPYFNVMTVRLNSDRIEAEDEVREVVVPQREVTRTVTHTTTPVSQSGHDAYGRPVRQSPNLRRSEPVRTEHREHTVTVTKEVNEKRIEVFPVDPTANPAYQDMLDFASEIHDYLMKA